jgi:methyltransferase, FkbM family
MNNRIINFLREIDVYDHLKIFKDQYFLNPIEKECRRKRIEFYSTFVKSGNLCFDIGASYGNRSEIFLKLGAKVVALEPQPKPANYLKRKYKNSIILETKAAGPQIGKNVMFLSPNSALSSLSKEWINNVKNKRFRNIKWNRKIEIQVVTIDKLIELYGKPDYCKIDVEGYELDVLHGLSQPINLLSFEFTIPEFIDKAIDCINYLSNLGDIKCNYSAGETMEFGIDNWISKDEFIPIFRNLTKKGIIDGDIYIKFL